jgi:N-acetylmuramic acid 6-phosphate etherase
MSTTSLKRLVGASMTPDVLGLEAGGTRTVALLAGPNDTCRQRVEAGPANLRLLDDAALRTHFRHLARQFPRPAALGIGMAGAREESDRRRMREAAANAWPGLPCWVGNDLDTAFAAAGTWPTGRAAARIIVISGTGSCCYGRNRAEHAVKVGGWGHLLGDRGSAYDVALRALQTVLQVADRDGRWPALGQRLLRALALNEPNDLVTWVHAAPKGDVAALAIEVFAAWTERDRLAGAVVAGAVRALAEDALACARRLARAPDAVEFVFTGGTLLKQPAFAERVGRDLRRGWPAAQVRPLDREGVWGAVALARAELARVGSEASAGLRPSPSDSSRPRHPAALGHLTADGPGILLPVATAPSPTEQRNPRSEHLDRLPLEDAIRLMLEEDAALPAAVLAEQRPIARTIRLIVAALRRGGRLWYVGAGTSGRLGVLDASECPPTFSVPAGMVQGILAGGQAALWSSLEGAEDDAAAGARAVEFRGVAAGDVVVGIAASGRTPFVWGALHAARRLDARTALVCFNPNLRFPPGTKPDVVVAPEVGPEVLTGSTRLKAGTATKLVLNLLTTLAMVRLGKVVGNLMVDVRPSNAKLRDRAVRIVQTLTGRGPAEAEAALAASGWEIRRALQRRPSRAGRP